MAPTTAEVAEQVADMQKLRRSDAALLEELNDHPRLGQPIGPQQVRGCARVDSYTGPGHLKFLEVGFLKPRSNNPRSRYA